jgi:hypothetical protein
LKLSIWLMVLLIAINALHCGQSQPVQKNLRIALFNIKELSTQKLQNIDTSGKGLDKQLQAAARIIQWTNPDILIIEEIDHDYSSLNKGLTANAYRFQKAYLNQGENGIEFRYIYTAPCNTGILAGLDIDNDGITASEKDLGKREFGGDSYGFGTYPGQYAMALFSKYPIDTDHIRTFQKFLWKDLTGHHIPLDFYIDEVVEILRLSSKSHWDVPILIRESKVHLLISHPTPPIFDGKEDRNGRRNFDELKFWVQYLANDSVLYDDQNKFGGFTMTDPFIIAGDLNASLTSDSRYDGMVAIEQLIKHPNIKDTGKWLISNGSWEERRAGPPDYWERMTAQFGRDFRTRIDYLLVSEKIDVAKGGVYWPSESEDSEGSRLAKEASDHRLLWLDIVLPGRQN